MAVAHSEEEEEERIGRRGKATWVSGAFRFSAALAITCYVHSSSSRLHSDPFQGRYLFHNVPAASCPTR